MVLRGGARVGEISRGDGESESEGGGEGEGTGEGEGGGGGGSEGKGSGGGVLLVKLVGDAPETIRADAVVLAVGGALYLL